MNQLLSPIETEALINAVHRRPPLWDRFDKLFTHRPVVNRLWKEVSKELQQPEHLIRKRWKGCKDTYRKKLKRTQQEGYDPTTETDTKWPFFEQLSFLQNNICYKNTEYNTEAHNVYEIPHSPDDYQFNDVIITNGAEYEQQPDVDNYLLEPECAFEETSSFKVKKSKRKRRHSNESEIIKLEQRKLELIQKLTEEEIDDNYQFLMSMLKPLRQMDTTTNMWFRLKVQELLYSCYSEPKQ